MTGKLKHLDCFEDRHGKPRVYFRRGKGPRTELPPLDSPKFMDAYAAALAASGGEAGAKAKAAAKGKPDKGTIRALVLEYYASPDFRKNKASTRTVTRGILDRFVEAHGHRKVADLRLQDVNKILGRMADTPGAANSLRSKLRTLMRFAIVNGWRESDPVQLSGRFKQGTHHTWTDAECAQFEARWPLGTRERTAYALALYTTQRRSDLAAMTWGHWNQLTDTISVAQDKGDMEANDERLEIPVHPELRRALEAWPRHHLTILASPKTRGMSAASFGNFMAEAIDQAGLPDRCVLHGLRKAGCRRLAEAGATTKQIQSISGHKTLDEVERYTRAASQKRLAEDAIGLLAGTKVVTHFPKPPEAAKRAGKTRGKSDA